MKQDNSNHQQDIKINWFPGHMKKATDQIINKIRDVDFIIQVLDARGIDITMNHELIAYVNNKPIINVVLKSDLSDISNCTMENLVIGSIKNKQFRNEIINLLTAVMKPKINKLKAKGLVNYQFLGIVIGIPNVGKSSLINFLANNHSLIVRNEAGVTKKQTIKQINNNFYLIDTPGVLFKNINNLEDGYKLSILNNITNKVLPMYDVIKFQYNFLKQHYLGHLNNYFNLDTDLSYEDFLLFVANKYQFIEKNHEIDLTRTLNFLFNLFSKSEICKFHY